MHFEDFIDLVVAGEGGNDCYLVANNHFFERPAMAGLLEDIGALPGYLQQEDKALGRTFGSGRLGPLRRSITIR